MQVGTYPTRNFATLGPLLLRPPFTGASVQCFLPKDSHLPLTFQHRAGVRPYTSSLDFAEPCVFDKQSPGPLHCGPDLTSGRPFSRSYGSILPSSLAMNLSSALEYSSQPPVSVYGTGRTSRFSWKSIRWIITLAVASVYYRGVTTRFNVQFRLHAPTSRLRRF